MKQRSLPKMFGLFIITLGIYRLYWFAKTRREMMASDKKINIPTIWLLLTPYILVAASVFLLLGTLGKSSLDAHQACERYGVQTAQYDDCTKAELHGEADALQIIATASVYLTALAFMPLTAVWLWSYSKGVERITKDKIPFPMAMLIVVAVPDGVDMLIVQDSFNKLSQNAQT